MKNKRTNPMKPTSKKMKKNRPSGQAMSCPPVPRRVHRIIDRLLGARLEVCLVGAGGNGSQMLNGLARMELALRAVGHPGIDVEVYDPDIVTQANVGRQLFSPSDVGQPKANILVHRINCFYNLKWTAVPDRYSAEHHTNPDILIGCVDTIAARRELARCPWSYWLDLGNTDKTGQVVLGRPKGGRFHARDEMQADPTRPLTVMEMFPELRRGKPREDDAPSCSLAGALDKQDLFINQSVATLALHLLWTFIRKGEITCQGYFINLEAGRVVPIPLPNGAP